MPKKLSSDFYKLAAARLFFTLGSQMQAIILGWRMYDLTKDPLYLGLVGLVEAIPALGLALYAGYLVDHGKPLRIYQRVMDLSLLSALVLAFSHLPKGILHTNVNDQIFALYLSSFLTGLARSFSQPSVYALIPRIVARTDLQRSSAWMTTALQIGRIAGPAVGGVLYGWFGVGPSALVVCLTLALAAIYSRLIKLSYVGNKPAKRTSIRKDLLSSIEYVFKHPILFPALSLDMISVLFGGVTAILPVYAAEILHVGPKGLGILRAAPALGAAITSIALTRINLKNKSGHWLLSSVFAFGLVTLVFALSKSFVVSAIALFLTGAFDSVSMVIRAAIVQLLSPDHMRGRISAVNSIFIGSSNELGAFESGLAARLLGTVPSVIFGSIMCVLTVASVGYYAPKLKNLSLQKLEEESAD